MTDLLPAIREPDQLERSLNRIDDVVRFAEMIAPTHFVPGGLRGKPDEILACIMLGRELGLGPMRSFSWIALVDGHPTLYSEGVRALVLARGHEIRLVEWTNTRCVLAGRRNGSSDWQEVSFTMDDARAAGLAGKPSWRQYPKDMLLARATGRLARLMFADVLAGLGTAEEYDDGTGSTSAASPSPLDGEGEATASPKTTRRRRRASSPEPAAAPASNSESIPDPPPADAGAADSSPSTDVEAAPDEEAARQDALLDEHREAERLENERRLIADLEASGAKLVDEAEARAANPEPISDGQRTKLHALFGEKGVESRDSKLAYATRIAGRPITSSSELTMAEASLVIDALEQWNPYDPATAPFPEGY